MIEDFYKFLRIVEKRLEKDKPFLFLNVEGLLGGNDLLNRVINSVETWREKVLLAENLYLRKLDEESREVIDTLSKEYKVNPKAPEISGFLVAYMYPNTNISEILDSFIEPTVSRKKLYRFLKFFFRYSLIFDKDISNILELIMERALEKLSFSSFLSVILNYFLPAFFVIPNKNFVEACIPFLKEIDPSDPRNLRFASALLLAESYFDENLVLNHYKQMVKEWYIEPYRRALFQSSLSVLGRAILIYSISKTDLFLKEAENLASDIYRTASYIRDANKEIKKNSDVSFEDSTIYLSEVEEEAVKSVFNPKIYVLRSALNLKEAIVGLATILFQRKILGLDNSNILESIKKASEELPKLPLHERADLLGSLYAVDDETGFRFLLKELYEKRNSRNIAQAYYLAGIWLGSSFPLINSFTIVSENWRKIVYKNEFIEGFSYGAYGIATNLLLKKLREGS